MKTKYNKHENKTGSHREYCYKITRDFRSHRSQYDVLSTLYLSKVFYRVPSFLSCYSFFISERG